MLKPAMSSFAILLIIFQAVALDLDARLVGVWPNQFDDTANTQELGKLVHWDIEIVDSTALVAADDSGLLALDVSDPAMPEYSNRHDAGGKVRLVEVQSGHACFEGKETGLQTVDVSEPTQPPPQPTVQSSPALVPLLLPVLVQSDQQFLVCEHFF